MRNVLVQWKTNSNVWLNGKAPYYFFLYCDILREPLLAEKYPTFDFSFFLFFMNYDIKELNHFNHIILNKLYFMLKVIKLFYIIIHKLRGKPKSKMEYFAANNTFFS